MEKVTIQHTYGTTTVLPTNIVKSGYNFKGWFNNSALTGTAVTQIGSTQIPASAYYAKFELPAITATVTWSGLNSATLTATVTVTYPSYSASNPIKIYLNNVEQKTITASSASCSMTFTSDSTPTFKVTAQSGYQAWQESYDIDLTIGSEDQKEDKRQKTGYVVYSTDNWYTMKPYYNGLAKNKGYDGLYWIDGYDASMGGNYSIQWATSKTTKVTTYTWTVTKT